MRHAPVLPFAERHVAGIGITDWHRAADVTNSSTSSFSEPSGAARRRRDARALVGLPFDTPTCLVLRFTGMTPLLTMAIPPSQIVNAEPDGPLALSLCALAALHHARARMARSTQPILEDPDNENSPPRQFYARALYRLMHAPQTNGTGQYSDSDAVAAIHLVSYSLLGGGMTDWTVPLDFACEWVSTLR